MGIVCGHNGSLFVYSADELILKEVYCYLYGKHYKVCNDDYEAHMMTLKDLSTRYNVYFKEAATV